MIGLVDMMSCSVIMTDRISSVDDGALLLVLYTQSETVHVHHSAINELSVLIALTTICK